MQKKDKKMKKNNDEKSFAHAVISWYPGHMAKTKKQIIEDLKLIDIVIEILDARIPIASQNPDINEIIKNKTRLIILNKSDLSCEEQNKKWIEFFEQKNIPAVLTDSVSGKGISEALKEIENIYENEKFVDKGRTGKSIRIMILGIPNVGKSSFINRVAKKSVAQTGNKPGVTRQKQWIKVSDKIQLLDTPGVLWPKFDNENIALNLSYVGTIKDDILQTVEIGYQLLKKLIIEYQTIIEERYKITDNQIKNIMDKDLEENEKILEIMNLIGKNRGAIISGGNIDYERVSNKIIDDFRSGKLGRITLEKP